MKTEYPVRALHAGKVCEVMTSNSQLAQQGDVLLTLAMPCHASGGCEQ